MTRDAASDAPPWDQHDPLACPCCGGALAAGEASWSCRGCARAFRAVLGIPDLRVPIGPAAVEQDEDWAVACDLAGAYPRTSFEDLIERLWSHRLTRDAVRRPHAAMRTAQLRGAPLRYARDLSGAGWLGALLAGRPCERVLDLGCGPGGFLLPAARRFPGAVGVDLSLAWLVICRKRLEDARVTARLLCACAERLPFTPDAFDLVVSPDVIEHVADRDATVREAHRVLRPGGLLVCTTPNRFSLTAEPHYQAWGVGLLPRAWMNGYVRWRTGQDFHSTYPLSARDLRLLFGRHFASGCRLLVPEVPPEEIAIFHPAKRVAARLYNRVIRLAPVRAGLRTVAPFFRVVAAKEPARGTRAG
ncbi:MAG: class I SAM-dependent methyltransferase [Thermodesulfobacteriota bacterium]